GHAAEYAVDTGAQVPIAADQPDARQIHGVVEMAIVNTADRPRFSIEIHFQILRFNHLPRGHLRRPLPSPLAPSPYPPFPTARMACICIGTALRAFAHRTRLVYRIEQASRATVVPRHR